MTDAFFDNGRPASPEDADDAFVDALLRGVASDEPARERARVEGVVRVIRSGSAPALQAATVGRSWRRWAVGSLASLASAAVVVLAVLVVREPEAGAASILDRAAARASSAGPRSFDVLIEFNGPESHAAQGILDLLIREEARPLVRLETTDPRGGDRSFGWDVTGPWVQRIDGGVDRPDPQGWTRRFLGGTLNLLVDDLPGFLAGLPIDHAVTVDDDPAGRPRLTAIRLGPDSRSWRPADHPAEEPESERGTERGSVKESERGSVAPRPGPPLDENLRPFDARPNGRPDGRPHRFGDRPPPPDGAGPPTRIELVFDPVSHDLVGIRLDWVREPVGGRAVGMQQPGPMGPGGPPPPLPARIRLDRISPRGGTPGWYSAPEPGSQSR